MRNVRVRALLTEIIARHPDVVSVEPVDLGGRGQVLRVRCSDGVEIDLLPTNTAPPGGDSHADPERVVSKRA